MAENLTVSICSFSYRKGVPQSSSEHGGGFVFDCRGIPNPGREERFKLQSGLDLGVAEHLDAIPESQEFFKLTTRLVQQVVERFRSRGFKSIEVCYGCTGGQHRSVYFAERLAKELSAIKGVAVKLTHRDLPAELRR